MALAGFAKQHRFNGTGGAQRFFYQTHSFDADKPDSVGNPPFSARRNSLSSDCRG